MGVPPQVMDEEVKQVDRSNFKVMYKEKEFMEEMLKAKNMMATKKKAWTISIVWI